MTANQTFYLPLIAFAKYPAAFEETDPTKASEQEIVRGIARGHFTGRILKVLAINEAAGTCRNVSKEIAVKVADYIVAEQTKWGVEEIDRDILDFLESHGSIYLANSLVAAE